MAQATLALALLPVCVSAQDEPTPTSTRQEMRQEVVWHWFGVCASSKDSLVLDVSLDGKTLYSSAFPICRARRAEIKPEPQQRLLEFRFEGVPHRFGTRSRVTEPQPIEGNIWETGGARNAILLGVSLSTEQEVLLNMHLVAPAAAPSRSERIRGLVITTRPVRPGGRDRRD